LRGVQGGVHVAARDESPCSIRKINGNKPLRRSNMRFRPLNDRIVVTRIDAEGKTAGGIIIPDTAKEKPTEGE
jgi:hypothetical protein